MTFEPLIAIVLIVSPLYDAVFTHFFGNQRNIANTRNFLKVLLDIPEEDFDKLTIKNTVLKPAFLGGKTGIVEMLVKKHPEMKQATNCARKFSLGDRIRTTILLRDMRRTAIRDRKEYLMDEARKWADEKASEMANVIAERNKGDNHHRGHILILSYCK